ADGSAVLYELGRHPAASDRGQRTAGHLPGEPAFGWPAAGYERGHAGSAGARRLVDSHHRHPLVSQLPA
nr:hypothetical protein [Tanacetum cinerariifolium]